MDCVRALSAVVAGLSLLGFSLTAASAQGLDLAPYKGKVVYLDFWASWCGPCRISFPWMGEMQSRLGGDGLVVIAVNVDREKARADDFLKRNAAPFKIVYDPAGALASRYAIKGMPTSVLIGRDGKIRYVHTGFLEKQENAYRAHIAELLNEKVPTP